MHNRKPRKMPKTKISRIHPKQPNRKKTEPQAAWATRGSRRPQPNTVKRGAFDRMKKIFGWLQDGAYPNCTSIASDLEVSAKTAARDVDFMRDAGSCPSTTTANATAFISPKRSSASPGSP